MKWEYIEINHVIRWRVQGDDREWPKLTDALNALGTDGWELASMRGKYAAILKRPIPSESPSGSEYTLARAMGVW